MDQSSIYAPMCRAAGEIQQFRPIGLPFHGKIWRPQAETWEKL